EVLSKQFHDNDRITVHCRIGERFLGQIDDSEATVVPHEGSSIGSQGKASERGSSPDQMEDVA
ncbi:MAG: hypothetical protein MI757_23305, partial [Pirellulales bacterium]|nr:hypothetical protein [Pirellulales bacterium]